MDRVPTKVTWASAATTLSIILGLTAACWVVAVHQMDGMDAGVATTLGSLTFFLGLWVSMMAAMMLPGTAPAVIRRGHVGGTGTVLPFVVSYLLVWTAVGLAVFTLYRPHGTVAAGILVILAGLYEFTPLKRRFRTRCHMTTGSGFEFGLWCVGSSIGLMLILVVVGPMSIFWMSIVTVLGLMQKLLPPRTVSDVPLALAIVGLGILILLAPSSVPGLMPQMIPGMTHMM